MALEMVLFTPVPVVTVSVKNAPKFMARLFASDVSKLASGEVERSVMLNASGGIIGPAYVMRTDVNAYEIVLAGEGADVRQAWIHQVSAAFDAELTVTTQTGFYYAGQMPVKELAVAPMAAKVSEGITFLNLRWISLVTGPEANITALFDNLIQAGAKKGEQSGFDALRILAREPAEGLEYDESTTAMEAGFEDVPDFTDPERIFIGRALTEARFKEGNSPRLHLVAFETAFDPSLLIDVPTIIVGDMACQLTSIARIPEMPLTVGLVSLPAVVKVGENVPCDVKTDPRSFCSKALVVDPQI